MKTRAHRYEIVRFHAPDVAEDDFVVKTRLTLEQAQAHCSSDTTKKEGEWFHGYREMDPPPGGRVRVPGDQYRASITKALTQVYQR